MATMIPSDIEEFGTEGEKAFYKSLERVAKPVRFIGLLSSLGLLGSQTSMKDKIGGRGETEMRRHLKSALKAEGSKQGSHS